MVNTIMTNNSSFCLLFMFGIIYTVRFLCVFCQFIGSSDWREIVWQKKQHKLFLFQDDKRCFIKSDTKVICKSPKYIESDFQRRKRSPGQPFFVSFDNYVVSITMFYVDDPVFEKLPDQTLGKDLSIVIKVPIFIFEYFWIYRINIFYVVELCILSYMFSWHFSFYNHEVLLKTYIYVSVVPISFCPK